MRARRAAGLLGLMAAVALVAAAFLPEFTGTGYEFRYVDVRAPATQWLSSLAVEGLHGLIYAASGLAIATSRRTLLAAGGLLGLGLVDMARHLFALALIFEPFSPAPGLWIAAAANLLAVAAGAIGVAAERVSTSTAPVLPNP